MQLASHKFYWQRHKLEKVWRVGYVGEDPDGNQWFHVVGVHSAFDVSKMSLPAFDWVEIEPPNKACSGHLL